METKMTEAVKLFTKAVNACGDDESLLVVYSGKDDGSVTFTGNPRDIAVGLSYIMANGLQDEATDEEHELAESVLNGLYKVLAKGDEIADRLAEAIGLVVREAKDKIERRNKDKRNGKRKSVTDEFNPDSKECLLCEGFEDCATRWLTDRVRNARKARNNGKRTKKTRKNGNCK